MRQDINKDILRDFSVIIVFAIETGFCSFNVPVAEIVPCEIVNAVSSFTQFEFVKVIAYIIFCISKAVKNPFVCQCQLVFVAFQSLLAKFLFPSTLS